MLDGQIHACFLSNLKIKLMNVVYGEENYVNEALPVTFLIFIMITW